MINITELLEQIVNGEMDPFRDKIMAAFKVRSANRNMMQLSAIEPGMKVKLINCQKGLAGAIGVVQAVNRTRVIVDLEKRHGKWYQGVSCPPGLLEIIK